MPSCALGKPLNVELWYAKWSKEDGDQVIVLENFGAFWEGRGLLLHLQRRVLHLLVCFKRIIRTSAKLKMVNDEVVPTSSTCKSSGLTAFLSYSPQFTDALGFFTSQNLHYCKRKSCKKYCLSTIVNLKALLW